MEHPHSGCLAACGTSFTVDLGSDLYEVWGAVRRARGLVSLVPAEGLIGESGCSLKWRKGSQFCRPDSIGAKPVNPAELVLKNKPIGYQLSDNFLQTKHKDFCVNMAFCSSFFYRVLVLKFKHVYKQSNISYWNIYIWHFTHVVALADLTSLISPSNEYLGWFWIQFWSLGVSESVITCWNTSVFSLHLPQQPWVSEGQEDSPVVKQSHSAEALLLHRRKKVLYFICCYSFYALNWVS